VCHISRQVCSLDIMLYHMLLSIHSTAYSFDVEFPEQIDDEDWANPDPAQIFKQPSGKPSDSTYFLNYLKLHLIHSHALRTIVRFARWPSHVDAHIPAVLS
jgi:hypothetical protein